MFVICKQVMLREPCYTYLCGDRWGSIHKANKYATQNEAEIAILESQVFEVPCYFLLLDTTEYSGETYNRLVYRFY